MFKLVIRVQIIVIIIKRLNHKSGKVVVKQAYSNTSREINVAVTFYLENLCFSESSLGDSQLLVNALAKLQF